jgi:3',5'-cyclic AMP phosphodiesterase CpdA
MRINPASNLKKRIACVLLLSLAAAWFPASTLNAKPKVTCEVKVVANHPALVTFTWDVRVESDRSWDACDLIISFEDEKGREIYSLRETHSIGTGSSHFSGHEVCDAEIWKRVRKYVTTFDCVF